MFDKGLGIAVCPYYDGDTTAFWDRVGVITDFNGEGGEQSIATEEARRERTKTRKTTGGYEKKDAIAEGNPQQLYTSNKPRSKGLSVLAGLRPQGKRRSWSLQVQQAPISD